MSSLSAIMLLKVTGEHYAQNAERAKILLQSIAEFGKGRVFDRFYVISPDDEVSTIKDQLVGFDGLEFVADSDLSPGINSMPATGWKKQQFLKMAAVTALDEDFQVTFDPDIFATREFDRSLFIEDGNATLEREPVGTHHEWWTAAARLLQVQNEDLPADVMTVTPCVYSRCIMRRLRVFLEAKYADDWMNILLRIEAEQDWVEHALYYCAALKFGLIPGYHSSRSSVKNSIHSDENLWFAADADKWSLERCFTKDGRGVFSVIASSTHIRFDRYSDRLKAMISECSSGSTRE